MRASKHLLRAITSSSSLALAACGAAPEAAKAPLAAPPPPALSAPSAKAEAPQQARLDPPAPPPSAALGRPDLRGIDLAKVPLVERRPAPPPKVADAIARAQQEGSPQVDYSASPVVRLSGREERRAVSVILTHAVLLHQEKVDAWSFYQHNPEVPPVRVSCGGAEDLDRVVETHTVAPGAGDDLVYSYHAYVFNFSTCKGRSLSAYSTRAVPVAGSLAYVFRARCPSCDERRRDELHVISPSPGSGRTINSLDGFFTDRLTYRALPLVAGSAATLIASFFPADVRSWDGVVRAAPRDSFVKVRIETSYAPGEDAPTVTAWRE